MKTFIAWILEVFFNRKFKFNRKKYTTGKGIYVTPSNVPIYIRGSGGGGGGSGGEGKIVINEFFGETEKECAEQVK